MPRPEATPALAILAATAEDLAGATALAGELQLPLLPAGTAPARVSSAEAVLLVAGSRLSLQRTGRGVPGPVAVDFGSSGMRHRRRGGHNELLGRAVGVAAGPGLQVLDATAGLGRDSFVLADLGCRVTLCERNPVIACLLRAGMACARGADDAWLRAVLGRMELVAGDARDLPAARLAELDVIYLDPMFPRRDKRAAVKKEMALFQLLLAGSDDAAQLLAWALAAGVPRVVVKRPPKAEHLAGRRPSHQLAGKAVRYDVYQRGNN